MSNVNILVIGRNKQILNTLVGLVNKMENCTAFLADTDESAITIFKENHIQLVLLSSGISQDSENFIRTNFLKMNNATKIIQHYGGGSGLLYNEIMEALIS